MFVLFRNFLNIYYYVVKERKIFETMYQERVDAFLGKHFSLGV